MSVSSTAAETSGVSLCLSEGPMADRFQEILGVFERIPLERRTRKGW